MIRGCAPPPVRRCRPDTDNRSIHRFTHCSNRLSTMAADEHLGERWRFEWSMLLGSVETEVMAERDVETISSVNEFVAKLRRLADALESGESFRIQIAGERFRVPKHATLTVEHERSSDSEEVELQLKWSLDDDEEGDDEAVV